MIKQVVKYAVSALATLGAILVGVSHIWDIPHIYQIGQLIAVVVGAVGAVWLCDKAYKYCTKVTPEKVYRKLLKCGYDDDFCLAAKEHCEEYGVECIDFFAENSYCREDGETDED